MKDEREFVGIFAATVTPFTDDGVEINRNAIQRLTDRLIGAGVAGLVPCGSTGEFPHLTHQERIDVVDGFIEAAAGRVPVIPHTGALTTAEAIDLSQRAEASGASAVMVVPPFYDVLTWRELVAHFQAIADAISLPIVYYNIPSVTGVRLNPREVVALVEAVPSIRYLKDTTGNASALTELVERYSDRIATFNGWDSMTLLGFASGTRASIWGAVNVVPDLCVDLWRQAVENGDLAAARRTWKRIWPILNMLETHAYGPSVKAGCDLIGESAGPPRRPFLPLETAERAELADLLRQAGVETIS
jgi:4-hydroxy-tetrahydrodipicolinate synthase